MSSSTSRPAGSSSSLRVNPTTLGGHLKAGIVTVTVVLVLVGFLVGTMSYGFGMENQGRWDLISEQTVPAAWSSTLFLLSASLMLLAARHAHRAGSREWRWWIGLAVVAVAAAADEFFSFHERTMEPIREFLDVGGLLLYAWVIPGMVILLVIGFTFAGFIKRLERGTRIRLVSGAAMLVAGGVGMEMVGGWWAQEIGTNFGWMVVFTIEEGLEFAGATVIALAMLRHHERLGSTLLARRIALLKSQRDAGFAPQGTSATMGAAAGPEHDSSPDRAAVEGTGREARAGASAPSGPSRR